MVVAPGIIVGSVIIVCILVLYGRYALGSFKEYWYLHHTTRGRLELKREEARSRAQTAVNKLVTMDESDEQYGRWDSLKENALRDMHAYDNAIDNYDVKVEEEAMLKELER